MVHMNSSHSDDTRVRITVSIATSTLEFLEELVASGEVDSRSRAVDLAVEACRTQRADDELADAAGSIDPDTYLADPGVLGPAPADDDNAAPRGMASLDDQP